MRYLLLLLALNGCSTYSNPYTKSAKLSPIVRLSAIMNDGNKHFFCSGTVVSDKYIVTAAHCVAGAPPETEIIISSIDDVEITVAHIRGIGNQLDLALLEGSFKAFSKMRMETRTRSIGYSFRHSSHLQSCGYPAGGKLSCESFSEARPYIFMYAKAGVAMYPGMSGGPVIDLENGRLIGVNSAMSEQEAIFTPVVEIFKFLNVSQD